jgi:hypothetical protein
MTNQIQELIASLPEIDDFEFVNGKLVEVKTKPTTFVRDGALFVSAEDGKPFANYYDLGHPYIHPALEAWASKRDGYWEWENPGAITFAQ